MADPAAIKYLADRDQFVDALNRGLLPKLDFSNEQIRFDFSGLRLAGVNFAFCNLAGSNFSNCDLDHCHFDVSDWAACNFSHATFNGCFLSGVQNAHKAAGLETVRGNGILMNFETAQRPWWNKFLDWEAVGAVGRLPLFTASSVALVVLPVYFYFLDVYNRHLLAWKAAFSDRPSTDSYVFVASDALDKLSTLPVPTLSLASLISALLLFFASGAVCCPPRIKQFSREQWCYQLERSLVEYWPLAWRWSFLRLTCICLYLVGGALALSVVSATLYDTFLFVWRNS